MSKTRDALTSIVLAVVLAGCGGGAGTVPQIASPAQPNAKKGTVTFSILVPAKSAAKKPAYVSPATQSMTVSIMQGTTPVLSQTVGLTPTSTGCTSTLASTQCALQLTLAVGSYTASISTFDGRSGAGNELSAAQAVAFTVVANTSSTVPLTLSGIPAQIDPTYLGSGKFMVVALDADGNYIIGAGSPTFTVAKSGGASAVTITQPTTSAPNAFSIAGSGAGTETVTITAGYPADQSVCALTGAVCTSSFTATYGQVLFALNEGSNNVLGYALPFTSASQTPTFTYPDGSSPYGPSIALDSKGNLFFAGGYAVLSPVYEVAAGYSGSPVSLFSIFGSGLAFDSNNNLFASNYTSANLVEYASPYTGSAVSPFNPLATSAPWFIAIDANNDLFVANYDDTYITEYPYSSGSYGSGVEINTDAAVYTLWLDSSGDVWVGTASTIQEFKPSGFSTSTAAATITGAYPDEYCPGVFDSSGDLFVQYYATGGSIDEYMASTIATGGAISSPDVTVPAKYGCTIGVDASNNLYVLTYDGFGTSNGGIAEFALPLSGSSTPVYTVSSGFYEPEGSGVITKPTLTISL